MVSRNQLNGRRSSAAPSRVRFSLLDSASLQQALSDFASKKDLREYEQLVCSIRDAQLEDEDVHLLLDEALRAIPILNETLRHFVEAILELGWASRSSAITKKYQMFIVNLLSAHNYYTKHTIDSLVQQFLPGNEEENWPNGIPPKSENERYSNVHAILNVLLEIIPMCKGILVQSLINNFPYIKKGHHHHETYVHNMLWILEYKPEMKMDLLLLLFNKLIILDTHAPSYEIVESFANSGEMETEDSHDADEMKHPVARSLDICLDRLYKYFVTECHSTETCELDWEKTKAFYQTMITIFDRLILPTFKLHHVQFVMFFLCSFKTCISEAFINYLWKKISNPSIPTTIKQTAAAYISSFLCRAAFVPVSILKATLQQMTDWIHSYISSQDSLECANSDIRAHSIFYSVCQAVFYMVAFRQSDLASTKSSVTFLQNLNLAKIVTCKLNPLKVCVPAIVQHFASVTRNHQLAYCYSVIEHNTRSTIPVIYIDSKGCVTTLNNFVGTFFPFERYLLKRSGEKILPLHQEYKSTESSKRELDDEDDDFLNEQVSKRVRKYSESLSTSQKK